MGKKCFTCHKKYKYMDKVERKSVKGLNANFFKTNEKLGDMLKTVGVKFSRKDYWDDLICCRKCWSILKQWSTLNQKAKELSERWKGQTGESLPVIGKPQKKVGRFKTQAARYVQSSEYGKAINVLRRYSHAAREAWLHGVARTVMKEMVILEKQRNFFGSVAMTCDWKHVLEVFENEAPTLYYVFVSAMSRKGDLSHSNSRIQALGASRLGTMLHIALHQRKPKLHKLFPTTVANSLWGSGSKQKAVCVKSLKDLGTDRRDYRRALLAKYRKRQTRPRSPTEGRLPVPYHEEIARGEEPEFGWVLQSVPSPTSEPNSAKKNPKEKDDADSLQLDVEEIQEACNDTSDDACDDMEPEREEHTKHIATRQSTYDVSTKPSDELTTTPEVGMEVDISQAEPETVEYDIDVPRPKKRRKENVITEASLDTPIPCTVKLIWQK